MFLSPFPSALSVFSSPFLSAPFPFPSYPLYLHSASSPRLLPSTSSPPPCLLLTSSPPPLLQLPSKQRALLATRQEHGGHIVGGQVGNERVGTVVRLPALLLLHPFSSSPAPLPSQLANEPYRAVIRDGMLNLAKEMSRPENGHVITMENLAKHEVTVDYGTGYRQGHELGSVRALLPSPHLLPLMHARALTRRLNTP